MPDSSDHDHDIAIKGGSFSLSDLGHLLPGMAEIMPLVGERIHKCYYAGKAGNKVLARFQLAEAVNLMEKGSILRPKYTENMDKFIAESVGRGPGLHRVRRLGGVRDCLRSHDRTGQRQPRVL